MGWCSSFRKRSIEDKSCLIPKQTPYLAPLPEFGEGPGVGSKAADAINRVPTRRIVLCRDAIYRVRRTQIDIPLFC